MRKPPQGKSTAVIAYFTLLGALIAISMNSEPKYDFARFHTRQAFGIHLVFFGFFLFLSVWYNFYVWVGSYILYFGLFLFGLTSALNNKTRPIPGIGLYFQRWFTFIQ